MLIGHLSSSLARTQVVGSRLVVSSLEQSIKADVPLIIDDLPSDAIEFLAGARQQQALSGEAHEALLPLVYVSGATFELAQVPKLAGLLDGVHSIAPGWPTDLSASTTKFAALVAGWDEALWCDRYLYGNPKILSGFLSLLRKKTDTRFRLLGALPTSESGHTASEVRTALQGHVDVEARFMHRLDYKTLHDRHLVHIGAGNGFVLPVSRAIFGLDNAGSAIVAPAARFGIIYADYWRRASPV
ncbi:hypothetical protein OHA72_06075 [Dactylosporangium sp. NBC_01737]|uniref:hypothetical protein n=1 Tax=Dactylosporangium sp. NBC_01737 TaxID=2975959 RepID=UPI002E1046E6|nr:hypothetical protein OHA72_06075 [Dactylosporangium sp. NBC_01737]